MSKNQPKGSLQTKAVGSDDQSLETLPDFHRLVPMPTDIPSAYVYGCSPRGGGNTDFARMLIESELDDQGIEYDGCFLREYKLHPCGGCQSCGDLQEEICRYEYKDESRELFAPLLGSQSLFFVAPIYFYHVPAQFKAFIDRGQAYWVQRRLGSPVMLNLPKRKAHVVLLCAREKGEKMFMGSLLSLRFFLAPFNIELAEPLLLRNLDKLGDLAGNKEAQAEISNYARQACRTI